MSTAGAKVRVLSSGHPPAPDLLHPKIIRSYSRLPAELGWTHGYPLPSRAVRMHHLACFPTGHWPMVQKGRTGEPRAIVGHREFGLYHHDESGNVRYRQSSRKASRWSGSLERTSILARRPDLDHRRIRKSQYSRRLRWFPTD